MAKKKVVDEETSAEELPAVKKPKPKKSKDKKPKKMSRRAFEKELIKLQTELVRLQGWVKHKGLRVAIVFEGRDAAGKGGVIKRITERVSPRVFQVVALPAPTERQKTQMYLQRYIPHFPAAGEVKIFDRSWYNRAGVEHVMGFCTDDEYERFQMQVGNIEREMVRDGIILIKYFFDVTEDEQERRFKRRFEDPMRQWKLSPMDLESWARWWDYTAAYDRMIAASDTPVAPWYMVQADDKRRARLNCISHLLSVIPYEEVPYKEPAIPKKKKRKPGQSDGPMFLHVVPNKY